MSYASYRISRGSGPRRLVALCVGILAPVATVFALDHGLNLNLVQRFTDIVVVPVHPTPPQPQPKAPDPLLNPTYDVGNIDVPPPVIPSGQTSDSPTVTATNGPDLVAQFRASNRYPLYPESATRNCEQGSVALNLRIGADGRVVDASVANSSGYPALDDAALRASRDWRFTPARQGGQAVESTLTQIVKFDLRNEIGVSMTAAEVRQCLKG